MSLLSDREIVRAYERGAINIDPFDRDRLEPASVDLTLHELIRVPDRSVSCIDVARVPAPHTSVREIGKHGYHLQPGDFILGSTCESVRLDDSHAARAEGISSLGRLGVAVHVTAGWIDPGFEGQVTLEIVNHAPWTVVLRAGMRIAQLAFFGLSPVLWSYSLRGSYQDQVGPTESKYRMTR